MEPLIFNEIIIPFIFHLYAKSTTRRRPQYGEVPQFLSPFFHKKPGKGTVLFPGFFCALARKKRLRACARSRVNSSIFKLFFAYELLMHSRVKEAEP